MSASEPTHHRRFLVTGGGPSHRLEVRLGLIRTDPRGILRRSFTCILATWVPLLGLAALQGHATGRLVAIPFLGDFAVHARFLLAVPMLLAAAVLGPWLADAAGYFVDSGLVAEEDTRKFDTAIDLRTQVARFRRS